MGKMKKIKSKSSRMSKKQRLKHKLNVFKVLSKLDVDEQNIMIDALSDKYCSVLCEGVKNVYDKNHHNLSNRDELQKKLSGHKDIIKKLIKSRSPRTKRKKLKQLGKGLGLILASLIPLITQILK